MWWKYIYTTTYLYRTIQTECSFGNLYPTLLFLFIQYLITREQLFRLGQSRWPAAPRDTGVTTAPSVSPGNSPQAVRLPLVSDHTGSNRSDMFTTRGKLALCQLWQIHRSTMTAVIYIWSKLYWRTLMLINIWYLFVKVNKSSCQYSWLPLMLVCIRLEYLRPIQSGNMTPDETHNTSGGSKLAIWRLITLIILLTVRGGQIPLNWNVTQRLQGR